MCRWEQQRQHPAFRATHDPFDTILTVNLDFNEIPTYESEPTWSVMVAMQCPFGPKPVDWWSEADKLKAEKLARALLEGVGQRSTDMREWGRHALHYRRCVDERDAEEIKRKLAAAKEAQAKVVH